VTEIQAASSQLEKGRNSSADELAARAVMIILRLFRTLERVSTELTPQQYRILKLAGAGGERSARLAERLAVAKPTLTATADALVAAGYARRDAEAGDRRVVRLCPTAEGREVLDRADAAYGRWLGRLLAETGEPDLVLHALDLLNQAMDELHHVNSADARRP
jgi:DNA-binding MarR family transcriptional regulator